MPAVELTESISGAPTTLALRKNSADSPSLLERGGVRSGGSASVASSDEKWSAKRIGALVTLVAGIVLLPTCVAMVFIDT